ncbi:hypothetical protein ROTAS13_02597 [Roseomonas sp. TAS13]|nr:hypothetical protein ROTAS13_02597 [Roseomonas sp. TAS13]
MVAAQEGALITRRKVERFRAMRRADIEDRAAGGQHELRLREPFPQLGTPGGRVAVAGDLDIVADDHVGAGAGDVAQDARRQHRGIAQRALAPHGEAVGGPFARAVRQQMRAERVPRQDTADIGHHARGQCRIRRQDQDARLRVAQQGPGAPEPDQRGLAAAAEGHQQQPPVAIPAPRVEPARDAAVDARRGLAEPGVPDPGEFQEVRPGGMSGWFRRSRRPCLGRRHPLLPPRSRRGPG